MTDTVVRVVGWVSVGLWSGVLAFLSVGALARIAVRLHARRQLRDDVIAAHIETWITDRQGNP